MVHIKKKKQKKQKTFLKKEKLRDGYSYNHHPRQEIAVGNPTPPLLIISRLL